MTTASTAPAPASAAGPASPGRRFGTDPAFLIPVATFLLTIRVPEAILLMGVVGLVLLIARRRFQPGGWSIVAAYAVCVVSATVANTAQGIGFDLSSHLWPALSMGLFTAAVVATGDRRANVRGMTTGLFLGLAFALLMAGAELASGWRLMAQGANKEAELALAVNPWRTAAFYTNYNDFSIAMTLFAILLATWILFAPRAGTVVKVARLTAAAGASALVLLMGSRGALLALVAGLTVAAVLAARAHHPSVVTFPRLAGMGALLSPALWWAWQSPYFQDSSTGIRERILANAETLLGTHPLPWLVGLGSHDNYRALTESAFPGVLMDPHNLVLEMVLCYGLVGLFAVGAVWLLEVSRGLSVRRPAHWLLPAYTSAAVTIPLMGIVPSSLLPYGFVQLIAAGLVALVADQSSRWSRSAGSATTT